MNYGPSAGVLPLLVALGIYYGTTWVVVAVHRWLKGRH